MRPAAQAVVSRAVDAVAVAHQHAGECRAERVVEHLGRARSNQVERRVRGDEHPQPQPLSGFAPAGLVDVGQRRALDVADDGHFQRCHGPRCLLHRLVDQPDRQVEGEEHLHQLAHPLARQPHAQAQEHDDGRQARTQQALLTDGHALPRPIVGRAVGLGPAQVTAGAALLHQQMARDLKPQAQRLGQAGQLDRVPAGPGRARRLLIERLAAGRAVQRAVMLGVGKGDLLGAPEAGSARRLAGSARRGAGLAGLGRTRRHGSRLVVPSLAAGAVGGCAVLRG